MTWGRVKNSQPIAGSRSWPSSSYQAHQPSASLAELTGLLGDASVFKDPNSWVVATHSRVEDLLLFCTGMSTSTSHRMVLAKERTSGCFDPREQEPGALSPWRVTKWCPVRDKQPNDREQADHHHRPGDPGAEHTG